MNEGSVYDWLQRRPLLLDVPLAGLFVLITTAGLGFTSGAWLLVAPTLLALVVRRSHPTLAFTVVCLGLLVRVPLAQNVVMSDLAFLVVLYSLSAYERRRPVRLAGLGVAALGSAIGAVRFTSLADFPPTTVEVVFTFVALAGASLSAWTLGDLKRARQQRLTDLRDRAERVERERENELHIAVQQERAAIAREMHDVVAHALSVIVVQADGAAYAAEHRTDDTRGLTVGALKTIGATARDALGETRRLVGVLRDPASGAELAPTGGLALLGELVDRVRAAGLPVALEQRGEPVALTVALDLAAYRVVQESLTNVIKHAGPLARATVTITHEPDTLRISVRDDGVGADAAVVDGRGHGLHGMRERVAVHAGVLTAGPAPSGGFEVRASLPLPPNPSPNPSLNPPPNREEPA